MKNKIIILSVGLVLFAVLATPALALTPLPPLTLEQQIASLRQQIASLTTQLNKLLEQQKSQDDWYIDPIESDCFDFEEDFGVDNPGKRANNLINLGLALTKAGFRFDGSKGGYDQVVVNVVKQFQAKYGIKQTGYVGPLTRAKLNELYGCNKKVFITPANLPIGKVGERYSNYSSPTLISHGLSGTVSWMIINGKLPSGLSLGKQIIACPTVACPVGQSCQPCQGGSSNSQIYGTPVAAGTYTFTVQATDGKYTATQTYDLVVKEKDVKVATSTITLLSPNGGETWMASTTQDIKWTWPEARRTNKVDIYLTRDWNCSAGMACPAFMPDPIILDKNIPARAAAYHWLVASEIDSNEITIPLGKYRVQICPAKESVWSLSCDSSDQVFTINQPLINDALVNPSL